MFKTIQIHYCLKSPGGDYASVTNYIKSFPGYAHVHESLWFVNTDKRVSEVRDELNRIVRTDDRVIVLDVTGDWWATNFAGSTTDWMQKNMGTQLAA